MKRRKQKKTEKPDSPPQTLSARQSHSPRWLVAGLAIAGLAGFLVWLSQTQPATVVPPITAPEPDVATNNATPSALKLANFQRLKGNWKRSDGDYVIEIKAVEDTGKLSAAYLNPSPIHVAKAEATHDAGATKVFIELQDVNYPGCTYTLVYLPERDLLAGVYYQALQRQSYEVYFERMK